MRGLCSSNKATALIKLGALFSNRFWATFSVYKVLQKYSLILLDDAHHPHRDH